MLKFEHMEVSINQNHDNFCNASQNNIYSTENNPDETSTDYNTHEHNHIDINSDNEQEDNNTNSDDRAEFENQNNQTQSNQTPSNSADYNNNPHNDPNNHNNDYDKYTKQNNRYNQRANQRSDYQSESSDQYGTQNRSYKPSKPHKPLLVTRVLQALNWKCEIQYCQNDSENHAILIAPYPETGANMHNPIIRLMFDILAQQGWNVLRFNFSHQAKLKGHMQCLVEANYITDWYLKTVMQKKHNFIVGGYSSGAFMSLELLMRRPEINGFIALALNGNINNNTFLAPYTHPGLFVHGKYDQIASLEKMQEIYKKMQHQQGNIELQVIDDDHFFTAHKFDLLKDIIKDYLQRLAYIEEDFDEDLDEDFQDHWNDGFESNRNRHMRSDLDNPNSDDQDSDDQEFDEEEFDNNDSDENAYDESYNNPKQKFDA